MKLALKIVACCVLALTATLFSLFVYTLNVTADAVFDENKLTISAEQTVYFDIDGDKMKDASVKDCTAVSLDDLPSHVKDAFIAIEDKRFYQHKGLDYYRIVGASLKNLKSRSFKEGASTISQQLIKNTHLTNEKTIKRKLKEIKLTKILEKRHTKDEILEDYLNTIYFGESAYGIESAAKRYFGKHASELTVGESAVLAGLIKAPTTYSPYRHPEAALKRRNIVLQCMSEQGYIDSSTYDSCMASPIELNFEKNSDAERAYINCVKAETEEILSNTRYGFYENFKVYTYFDAELNGKIEEEVLDLLPSCGYCAILTDNYSHGISALVTDTGLICRNPASTVKPWLVYAPAIEERQITAATKILDEKTNFNGYSPSNYNDVYSGYISAKDALSKSLNIPAVKIANCLGVEKMKKYAKEMNVQAEGGLGMALGGIESGMTIKQITDCYSVFANDGQFTEGRFVKKITTLDDKVIYEHSPQKEQVFSDSTAAIINDALRDCAINGTAKKLKGCKLPLCAKTGTNGKESGNIDAYSISYSPEFVLGIWLGNADCSLLNNSVSGGTYPAIISSEIWKILDCKRKITDFILPESVTKAKLDKERYDKDCVIALGTDGPEFLFAKGTEPIAISHRDDAELSDVKQFCKDGQYELTFTLRGYDGAVIEGRAANGKVIKGDCAGTQCTFKSKVKEGIEYVFTITPYKLEGDKREYGEKTTLPPVKYRKNNATPLPPKKDWWTDD